ncbi:thymidine phosphorylase [Marinosulfonomonas sp. PRT-SC04]|nr:thymidine phosphorylase [Marinosulfonomonas sp. PRT-SC04]
MDARHVLTQLRDKKTLTQDEITWFANGLATGAVSDAQAGAFAMGVLLNGLAEPEKVMLTLAMRDSGDVLKWEMPGPVVDKHSTGGVGDTVSLPLAPALAACGAYVPMISGRGLGHTGGTLDKLEAIPGYKTDVGIERMRQIVGDVGCAIVSASGQIAPADKRLYAVRDVTGTVESIDLITASILSKKLAAGLDNLVLDVKFGSGAFMKTIGDARKLARSLVRTANGAGCNTSALITDMSQPLASSLGNALEVMSAVELLTVGHIESPMAQVTVALGGEALVLSGIAADRLEGEAMIAASLIDGRAADIFGAMIAAQGGPADFVDNWRDRLPAAPVVRDILAVQSGRVLEIDGEALGMAVVHLGGGRLVDGARVDPSVGLSRVVRLGEAVDEYTPLALVHAANPAAADRAAEAVRAAITVGDGVSTLQPLIRERIT